MLPIIHGNDRVEWFVQLSDEIHWDIQDRDTGVPRARAVMKAGDVAAMPADIRHQGYSPKRSLLLVWENGDPTLPEKYATGKLKAESGGLLVNKQQGAEADRALSLKPGGLRFSCADPRGSVGFRRSLRG